MPTDSSLEVITDCAVHSVEAMSPAAPADPSCVAESTCNAFELPEDPTNKTLRVQHSSQSFFSIPVVAGAPPEVRRI